MQKNIMKLKAFTGLINKPAVLFTSYLFICLMFVGVVSANTPSHEGIKIHGHWEITVINPDGKIAQSVAFENALTAHGMRRLVTLLTGQGRVQRDAGGDLYWDLQTRVSGVADTEECNAITGNIDFGAASLDDAPTRASVSIPTDGLSFTLSRLMLVPDNCVLAASYTINEVYSGRRDYIDEDWDGASAYEASFGFTFKTLPAPIAVARGQAVSIKATFDFE